MPRTEANKARSLPSSSRAPLTPSSNHPMDFIDRLVLLRDLSSHGKALLKPLFK